MELFATEKKLPLIKDVFTTEQYRAFEYYYGCNFATELLGYPLIVVNPVRVQHVAYSEDRVDIAISFIEVWFRKWTDGNMYGYNHDENLLLKAPYIGD